MIVAGSGSQISRSITRTTPRVFRLSGMGWIGTRMLTVHGPRNSFICVDLFPHLVTCSNIRPILSPPRVSHTEAIVTTSSPWFEIFYDWSCDFFQRSGLYAVLSPESLVNFCRDSTHPPRMEMGHLQFPMSTVHQR